MPHHLPQVPQRERSEGPFPAPENRSSFLLQVWERLAAPFVALFADTDGRGVWDPDGLASGNPGGAENDGRSMWDPNG